MGRITNYEAFYALSTARALREVADDLRTGVLVHNDIHTFGDLHDFVDANGYGFLFYEEVAIDHGSDEDTFVVNAIQSTVSAVLSATDAGLHGHTAKARIDALERAADDLLKVYQPAPHDDPDDVGTLARFVSPPSLQETIEYETGIEFFEQEHPAGLYLTATVEGEHVVIHDHDGAEGRPYDIVFYSSEEAKIVGSRPLYERKSLTADSVIHVLNSFRTGNGYDPDADREEEQIMRRAF